LIRRWERTSLISGIRASFSIRVRSHEQAEFEVSHLSVFMRFATKLLMIDMDDKLAAKSRGKMFIFFDCGSALGMVIPEVFAAEGAG
jgi:hypothetical protein